MSDRAAVCEVNLESLGDDIVDLQGYEQALIVFRLRGSVIGQNWLPVEEGRITAATLRSCLTGLGRAIWQRLVTQGPEPDQPLPTASVVVCTRDRTVDLERCLPGLDDLAAQGHEVIVVDSCPSDDSTARLVDSYPAIRYVHEPRPGQGIARNRGLLGASGDVVAFTDDDAQVDPGWLRALLRNFDDPLVAMVTGITMPLELETEPQIWFEGHNGFVRGFERREFDVGNLRPLAAGVVGAGVNVAIRRSVLGEVGLFDEALGPGTLSRSGDDHEFFYRVLVHGYRIVYEPGALVWHRHRREYEALWRTIYGYGVGVFAWWTRALFVERDWTLLKWGPRWFWQHHTRNLIRSLLRRPNRVPLRLALAEFLGGLTGPANYLRSRRQLRTQTRPVARANAGPVAGPDIQPGHGSRVHYSRASLGGARNSQPTLSIIVPTHNRSALLAKSLEALRCQSWRPTDFEVVVVADACRDDTAAMVTAYAKQTPYQLRLLCHNGRSAALTRNLGAADAQGSVLLFLDDDVVAQPGLVKAHMEAQGPNRVILGYSKPVLPSSPGFWHYDARRWWEDTYSVMRQPGHRFTYRDFFSGNVSMPAALFHKSGTFDASLTGRLEDYELGVRLLRAGARFRYIPEAIGHHHESADLRKWLSRIRQEGVADIQIGERHPELRISIFRNLEEPSDRWWRILRRLAFAYPTRGDRLERLMLQQAALYEQLKLRNPWKQVILRLREYNYWRGIAATIGGRQALAAWLQEAPVPPAIASTAPLIDLTEPPAGRALEDSLQEGTNVGVRLAVGGAEVLAIPPQPGAEPLRQEHLHAALERQAEQEFIPALAVHLIRSARGGNLLC